MTRRTSLSDRMLTQFVVCIALLLLLATPLFYLLTKHYYAEDMIDVIEAVKQGLPIPDIDLKEDIMQGIMIQFAIIVGVLGIAIVLTLRFISRRLWRPFDETLRQIEAFRLEKGVLPVLPESDVAEFARLNRTLTTLMDNSLKSYRMQKEFTENASHELQTPLAVFQSRLDLLLQLPELTKRQADMMQSLYATASRLSHLNRNLLLLAKINNSQYDRKEELDVITFIKELRPSLDILSNGVSIEEEFLVGSLNVTANRTLFESLVNNLVVNAIRHNRPEGEIKLRVTRRSLIISNTSSEPALDPRLLFNRFYRPSEKTKGNGLGLAIVKSICDYHGWQVAYHYEEGQHFFTVTF